MKNKGNILIFVSIIIYLYILLTSSFLIYIFEKKDILNLSKVYIQNDQRKLLYIKRMEIYLSKKTKLNNRYFHEDHNKEHIFFSNNESIGGYRVKEIKRNGNDILLILSKQVLNEEIIIKEKIKYFNGKIRVKEVIFWIKNIF